MWFFVLLGSWVLNPGPQRVYPWGDTFDPNKANTDETQVGATNAVGCFALGVSPYGCEELAGNVWEWTRSLWGHSANLDFKYPYVPTDGREDLAAPDNVDRAL